MATLGGGTRVLQMRKPRLVKADLPEVTQLALTLTRAQIPETMLLTQGRFEGCDAPAPGAPTDPQHPPASRPGKVRLLTGCSGLQPPSLGLPTGPLDTPSAVSVISLV